MILKLIRTAIVLSLVMLVMSAEAQAPHEAWRTIETEHYRVHFTEPFEEWARYTAARLESVREIVGREVGYLPDQMIDVVVMDPVAQANGSAWPFLGYPRMVLWTSAPGPESVIGNYTDWVELLTIHEQAHLAHLLRPSRNTIQRFLGDWIGLGPIMLRAPRWAIEGYATVIEGDLTGAGRPQSDIRAAILRKWAQQGRLPSYGQMSSDSRSYLGMSMAYLAGSTFLEWLREREGEESFRNVWARLSAKRTRSFDEAFGGVYGDSPANLYARFRAELIHNALELEEELELLREGELWQDLSWQTGAPAVSPDGSKIAIVLRGREEPARLVVWETGEDEEALEKWDKEVAELLEEDPEDVPAVRRRPLRRKPKYELVGRDGVNMMTPRWIDDGSILFVRFEPDEDGFLHPDLFRWFPERGDVVRLTRGADLREPTPVSTTEVVAVRRRHGRTSLVRYDIASGRTEELLAPEMTTILGWPRADRAGERIAFSRHVDRKWRLSVLELATGEIRDIPLPGDATTVAWPEWSPDGGSIYATVGSGGLLDIWRFDLSGGEEPVPVTRSFGAAMAPSIGGGENPRLFFLSMDADGLDLHVLDPFALEPLGPVAVEIADLVAVGRPELRTFADPVVGEIGASRPYGIGDLETRWLFGGGRTPSEETFELGLRIGDLVGRLDTIIVGAISDGGPEGGSARAIWRGWPVEVEGHVFRFERRRSASPVAIPSVEVARDETRWGGELLVEWNRRWRDARVSLESGVIVDRFDLSADDSELEQGRESAFVALDLMRELKLDPWALGGSANLAFMGGDVEGESWSGWTGEIGIVAGLEDHSVAGWYRRGEVDDHAFPFVVGGAPTSLTPHFDHLVRVWSPGIVEGSLVGSEYEGWRAELETDLFPLVPFYEAHRAGSSLEGPWIDLAGLRLDLELAPFPLLKLPGVTLSLGGAYVLDGPRADHTEWWITTRWKLD